MREERKLGIVLIILAILLAGMLYLYTVQLIEHKTAECESACNLLGEHACIHEEYFPWETYVSSLIVLALLAIGIRLARMPEKGKPKPISGLGKEEKQLVDELAKAGGTMFQTELIEATGMNKVKVSRLLDRLEGKGAIERKRRGMANAVILKQ